MSPEQARGHQVDTRTDIWAFGCVLYEMLSGRRAFAGETISDTIAAILGRGPDWAALPATTALEVNTLLRRCLQKDPRRRLHDIADVRLVIEEVMEASDRQTSPAATRSRRSGAKVAAGIATLAIAAVLLALAAARVPGLVNRTDVSAPAYVTLVLPESVGLNSAPAVSPDGSSIAFVGRDATAARLYVKRLSSPQVSAIPGTEGARQPFWSPDGQWLAFFAGNKLKKIAVDGGAPVDICNAGETSGGRWGSRGVIVFTPHLIDAPRVPRRRRRRRS